MPMRSPASPALRVTASSTPSGRPGRYSALRQAGCHRIHAAQPPAHGYELGGGPSGTQSRGLLLRVEGLLDAGVPLAFGTDYPVETITPFRGLYAAVTRMNEAGTKTYFLENKITRGQALYAYTQGSAYAEFAEKHKGKLLPGYDADFILVDRNLYTVDAPAILQSVVRESFVAGQMAFAGNVKAQ